MKSILFQIGKQAMFPQKIQHLPQDFYMILALIFGVDKNFI